MAVDIEIRKPVPAGRRRGRTLPRLMSRITVPLQRVLGHYMFSSLTRRILFLNLAAMAVLVVGVLYLNTFRDGLRLAGVSSESADWLGGWSAKSTAQRYGGSRIVKAKLLAPEVAKLGYPGLDLSHLHER